LKKKVVIVTHHFLPEATGGASRIYEMARSLKDFYDIDIVCPPPTFPFTKYKRARYLHRRENVGGFRVFRLWTYQPSKHLPSLFHRILYYAVFAILASFFLITHLNNVSFVIITIPPSPLLISSLVVRLFKKKLIVDVRDLWIDLAVSLSYIKEDSIIVKVGRKFENYCWRNSDLIITNHKFIFDALNSRVEDTNKVKIKYFPFNVDLDSFKSTKEKNNEKQIVCMGNFGSAQNVTALISAFPLVLQKVNDVKIQLYGGGDCEPEMKRLVRDLRIEQYVRFNDLVPREEIPSILSRSTLGIIALSNNKVVQYALPTKTFEYFASGLPVIAYGCSDELERIMMESGAGIYVKGDDKNDIADAIVRMINDNDALNQCSINARKFAEQNTFYSLIGDVQTLIGEKLQKSSNNTAE
jgi:colanic acid biosynthesis glycosyl transferase WcaI